MPSHSRDKRLLYLRCEGEFKLGPSLEVSFDIRPVIRDALATSVVQQQARLSECLSDRR